MGSPERYSSFAMGVSPLEEKPEPPAGSIVMGLRASHFPQRMHDQEKGYSPAFRRQGERESSERKRQEEWEREKKEKCDLHEMAYGMQLEEYVKQPMGIEELDELNRHIRLANDYFSKWGCPSLPEIEPPPPTFATKL